ncbi:MAG: hypothetical protein NVS3B12_17300 [Acidimicrobiales bacterium]
MTAALHQSKRGHNPLDPTDSEIGTRRAWAKEAVTLVIAAVVVLAVMTSIGLLLTHTLGHSAVIRADKRLSDGIFRHRSAGWTSVTWWFTQFAEALTVVVAGALIALAFRLRSGRWIPGMFLLAALLGESTIYVLITTLVHRHRPLIKHLDAAPPTSSFPSGHVAASVCFYGALAILAWHLSRRRPLQILATVAAVAVPICVAAARVYRGMHFPTDVISGAILGTLWLAIVARVLTPEVAALRDTAAPARTPDATRSEVAERTSR